MALTKFDLCNLALGRLRVPAITSFKDGTTPSDVAGQLYEPTVLILFGMHRWRFAMKQQTLPCEATPPTDRWANYFTLPKDLATLQTVTLNGKPIEYDVFAGKIACNLSSSDMPTAEYDARVDEGYFPGYFQNLVSYALEEAFAGGITGKADMKEIAIEEKKQAFKDARRLDGQQRTARAAQPTRLLTYR